MILIGFLSVGPVYAQRTLPDIFPWFGSWFKLTVTQNEYNFDSQGVAPKPGNPVTLSYPAYLWIHTAWWYLCCPESQGLGGNLYTKDSSGNWTKSSYLNLTFNYFAGSDLKFVASTVYGDANIQFGSTILFSGKRNKSGDFVDANTTLKTSGGYITEIDDVAGSTKRWAGLLKMSGTRIIESKVPPELQLFGAYSLHETTETTPQGGIMHKYEMLPTP
jgi:hypothetical protein